MTGAQSHRRIGALGAALILSVTGCAFHGVNSLPLPGAVGRGADATVYHVEIANIGTLEPNSPVMINDVIVGSVGSMRVNDWRANVDVSVEAGVVVPANALATVGQTSLLGSMHLALDPPAGQPPTGRLTPGATLAASQSSTYPSTEQTLSALSVFINSGGVAQVGDIIHDTNAALRGREGQIRNALARLDTFVGTLDRQRNNITATIDGLVRLTATLSENTDTITTALRDLPPALDVLIRERPRLTTALDKLRTFSDVATGLVNDTQADLVANLQNLQPALKALADVGPKLDTALAFVPTFPLSQDVIDRGLRGDYLNLFPVIDLTIPRLKRTLLRGTRWADINTNLVPAPGDPYFMQHTYDPMQAPLGPTPGAPALDGAPAGRSPLPPPPGKGGN
jgi:virulence factor Mce-like protein